MSPSTVVLLDAYALIAFLVGGPAADEVTTILRSGRAAIATVNLAEALDVSERVRGLPIARARAVLDPLFDETIAVRPLELSTAQRAAELRAHHYHRTRCPISLADAVLLASAGAEEPIATADPAVLAVAAREQIETVMLPGETQ